MGMLFNNAATLKLLGKLNGAFHGAVYSNNIGNYLARVDAALTNLATDRLYKVSSELNIDLDVPSTRSNPNNWEKYLNHLETVVYPSQNKSFKEVILTALHNYLSNGNCKAIEFYAVEGLGYDLTVGPISTSEHFYGYILIQSLDVHHATAYFRATMSRPPKGTRKRAASLGVRVPAARRKPPEG